MTIYSHADVSATGVVLARPGAVGAVLLKGGSDTATLTLHDNASAASGTVLAVIAASANTSEAWTPPAPYACSKGIYATLAGTAANATVVYL